jgi:fucose permease
VITASSFLAMFFIGVGTAIIGAASRNIGISPYHIGLLIAMQNIGFGFSVVTFGTLADRFEKTRLMLLASLVMSLAFFFLYFRDIFFLNLFIMLAIGIGIGGYEGVADAMLLQVQDKNQGLYITVNHFFVTFGELMITAYLIFLQMNWRRGMVQSAAAVLALAVIFLLTKTGTQSRAEKHAFSALPAFFTRRSVLVLFALVICAVGTELSIVGVLTTFLMELRGFTQVTSKLGLVVFLGGLGLGRLTLGFITKKQYITVLIACFFGSVTLFSSLLFFVVSGDLLTYVFIFFTGVVISVIFPFILTIAGLKYHQASGTVLGIVKLGVPAGGILIPLLISLLSRYSSFEASLAILPLTCACGLSIILANRNELRLQ